MLLLFSLSFFFSFPFPPLKYKASGQTPTRDCLTFPPSWIKIWCTSLNRTVILAVFPALVHKHFPLHPCPPHSPSPVSCPSPSPGFTRAVYSAGPSSPAVPWLSPVLLRHSSRLPPPEALPITFWTRILFHVLQSPEPPSLGSSRAGLDLCLCLPAFITKMGRALKDGVFHFKIPGTLHRLPCT